MRSIPVALVVALCFVLSACGNPTTSPSSAYQVSPSVQSVRVGGTVEFTTYPVGDSFTWTYTVDGKAAQPAYIRVDAGGATLKVTALKATVAGKGLVVSALMGGKWVSATQVAINP